MKAININSDLKELYKECNKKYFGGRLPENIEIEWSKRMTSSAGQCRYQISYDDNGKQIGIPKSVKLSYLYHKKFENEILDTLVHEMIHVEHPLDGHGPIFKKRMKELNEKFRLNITQYTENGLETFLEKGWQYICNECGKVYMRVRRLNANNTCGICCGKLNEKHIDKTKQKSVAKEVQSDSTTKQKVKKIKITISENEILKFKSVPEAARHFGGSGKKDCSVVNTLYSMLYSNKITSRSKHYNDFKNIQIERIK